VHNGFDERKMVENNRVHPYWSIGKIEVHFENPITKSIGSTHGTAFVISKEHIMTAAHNFEMGKTGLKPKNIYFYPEPLDAADPFKNPIEAKI
jgi:V8-like Glu-specific endopeptidase